MSHQAGDRSGAEPGLSAGLAESATTLTHPAAERRSEAPSTAPATVIDSGPRTVETGVPSMPETLISEPDQAPRAPIEPPPHRVRIPVEALGSVPGINLMGATAVMAPAGPECPICRKKNHLGVHDCVFCGAPLSSSPRDDVAQSGTSSTSYPMSRGPSPTSDGELNAPPVADPLIGVVVAERYRIVELLGRGGMGIVYKVEHTRIGKLLAMKLLTGELSHSPDVVRRFKQEALTVSKLGSPNTVQVFDFGAAEGLTYLVMELVAGEDLGRILRSAGPMPFARLGKIIIQVCSSLAEAHQKGIVHRDIKPENIMILRGKEGVDVAKVLDFGLAKLREGEGLNDVTSQGAIVGTPYFMAPEQIRGEAVDARTDVYALGALMYRALTGHYPFNGPTPMAVFTKHLTEPPIPPIERAPELGILPGVNRLVLKALAKAPEHRYPRVEDLQAALVAEMRALGTSSVEDLLDSGQLRRLTRISGSNDTVSAVQAAAEIATRDEVEAYERKLRRQRYGAIAFAALVAIGAVFGAVKLVMIQTRVVFNGVEMEPNDSAKAATKVPLGSAVTGFLGKRLDPGHGDRDFYAYDLPAKGGAGPVVELKVSALPNFAMCTMLYRAEFPTAIGQYCVGRPGRDLIIPAMRVEPGRYFVAAMQDLDGYGGAVPFIHENVSDTYTITLRTIDPPEGQEIEPNDQVASATPVAPGTSVSGRIGWVNDEDVFCVPEGTKGRVRFRVHDGLRDSGVLEATPMRDGELGAPVRIHLSSNGKPSAAEVMNPWTSDPIDEDGAPRCLKVNVEPDPWSGEKAGVVPSGGSEPYTVEVEAVP
ncbi:MAG: serine/threonine-protein kinase [Byssovorax sp.]